MPVSGVEGVLDCGLSGRLDGALCVGKEKFARRGLALNGGDTAVLVCSGLGAIFFCGLAGEFELDTVEQSIYQEMTILQSEKFMNE